MTMAMVVMMMIIAYREELPATHLITVIEQKCHAQELRSDKRVGYVRAEDGAKVENLGYRCLHEIIAVDIGSVPGRTQRKPTG